VANFDEDSTTMAVEAAAPIVSDGTTTGPLWFATTSPAYVDKVNATAVHAALGLPADIAAYDLGANYRSGVAAIIAASKTSGLALMSDVREGKAGGSDERDSGDAAASFAFGETSDPAARLIAMASRSAEFLDRWRLPRSTTGTTWEERFGQSKYTPLGEEVVKDVLERAGISIRDVAGIIVTSPNIRASRALSALLQKRSNGARVSSDLVDSIGNSGAAQFGVELADQLERAAPGEFILAVSLADGADAVLFEAGSESARVGIPVRDQLKVTMDIDYAKYLLWRGRFPGEAARRPDPSRPSSPFAARNADFKYGFNGGQCRLCGTVQYPLPRVCLSCKTIDDFDDVKMSAKTARVVTYTVDRLAYTASPPLIGAVVDIDGGGRITCELTDVKPEDIAVGNQVLMTFRRLGTIDGIHNYFWKARPVVAEATAGEN
jgi:3-hydroxy-3-methylglutaryl CoA synthase/uncharacterized OB-fold protein